MGKKTGRGVLSQTQRARVPLLGKPKKGRRGGMAWTKDRAGAWPCVEQREREGGGGGACLAKRRNGRAPRPRPRPSFWFPNQGAPGPFFLPSTAPPAFAFLDQAKPPMRLFLWSKQGHLPALSSFCQTPPCLFCFPIKAPPPLSLFWSKQAPPVLCSFSSKHGPKRNGWGPCLAQN